MINSKVKVLVAGHSGFIGSSLVKSLEQSNFFELILVSGSNGFNLEEKLELEGLTCDVVINLAGSVSIDESWLNPYKYFRVNYLSTLSLIEYARMVGARFIQISSYTYGIPNYQPINEDHPIQGYNPYASSKIISDQLCKEFSKYFHIPVTIFKLFNIYGHHQPNNFIISGLINSAIQGDVLKVRDLHARRDYLWADDFNRAVEKLLIKQDSGFNVFNIGSGESHSAKDIIEIISSFIPNVTYEEDNTLSNLSVRDCVCDNSLFSKKYNWKPNIDLRAGIKSIINNL